MKITCPSCFARYSLDTAVQGDAARELNALLAKLENSVSVPLVLYIGLFRSKSRALGWERANRLALEVMALGSDRAALAVALSETVNSMRDKQSQPGWKPLTNHNYLKRVLETCSARVATDITNVCASQPARPRSKTGQGIVSLQSRKRRDD